MSEERSKGDLPGFSHMKPQMFVQQVLLTLNSHQPSQFFTALVDVERQGQLKPSGDLGTKILTRTRPEAFFPEMSVSPKKVFTFYAEPLMRALF